MDHSTRPRSRRILGQKHFFSPHLKPSKPPTMNQALAEGRAVGFSPPTWKARRTVASGSPSIRPIALHEAPERLREAIREQSTAFRGLPSRFPFALAFRRPALTRSAIKLRSSSATAPRTVKTIFPVGVLVSTCSERETNSFQQHLEVSERPQPIWETQKSVSSPLATSPQSTFT